MEGSVLEGDGSPCEDENEVQGKVIGNEEVSAANLREHIDPANQSLSRERVPTVVIGEVSLGKSSVHILSHPKGS